MDVKKLTGWLRGRRGAPSDAALAVVAGAPLSSESPVVRKMAERLRQRELAEGGWAAEAGGLPIESYLPEARRLVQRIALGVAEGGPPTP
ncbi:MAG: hypothetical protein U0893_19505 [Chloroflexota bacterium]